MASNSNVSYLHLYSIKSLIQRVETEGGHPTPRGSIYRVGGVSRNPIYRGGGGGGTEHQKGLGDTQVYSVGGVTQPPKNFIGWVGHTTPSLG